VRKGELVIQKSAFYLLRQCMIRKQCGDKMVVNIVVVTLSGCYCRGNGNLMFTMVTAPHVDVFWSMGEDGGSGMG
jgi:hypothetical protein